MIDYFKEEEVVELDPKWFDKSVNVGAYRLDFAYNAQSNYLYFDWYYLDGTIKQRHCKVLRDFVYEDTFYFTTDMELTSDVCTYDQVDFWNLVVRNG